MIHNETMIVFLFGKGFIHRHIFTGRVRLELKKKKKNNNRLPIKSLNHIGRNYCPFNTPWSYQHQNKS